MTDAPTGQPGFFARTAAQLQVEFEEVVAARHPQVAAKVDGDRFTLDLHEKAGRPASLGIVWISQCHRGVLDRLPTLFPDDRSPTSVELLALSRHLFETLIWLKLFDNDIDWGVCFYAQLLANERQDLDGLLERHRAELDRFRRFAEEEAALFDAVSANLGTADDPVAEARLRIAAREEAIAELDAKVRAGFNIHAAAATYNGYAYQAQIIETRQIKRAEDQRALIQSKLDAFAAEIDDEARVARYLSNWNWKAGARATGLVEQYDFFYRLTSRLLHATPMNLVTEKDLTDGERVLLHEFIVVAARQAYDLMEGFTFPYQLNVIALNLQA